MSIKIQGTTVIDDARNATNVASIQYNDASTQTTALTAGGSYGVKLYDGGSLISTLDGFNSGDFFGHATSMSGKYAIVGAYGSSTLSGKVHIYDVTSGQLIHTIFNPTVFGTGLNDFFGLSVAISGNYAIVGAYGEDEGGSASGKAYIFNVITGGLIRTLNNPNAYNTVASDSFGYSVAISGNYAIATAYAEDDAGGSNSGKAYIFNVTTGALIWTLNNPNAFSTSTFDYFGSSVAISGNYAIVGAYQEDDAGGASSGKAYIFNVTTGALLWTLNNPNAFSTSDSDWFGYSVAVSGNYAIVGTPFEGDAGGILSGKAYIYNVTTGVLVWTLNNPNAFSTSEGDYFGYSVDITGNYAIVGAYQEDDAGGADSGKAYIFDVTTGALVHTLNNPNAFSTSEGDYFGWSVAISGNYATVGAYPEDNASGVNVGKAYIFAIDDVYSDVNIMKVVFDTGVELDMNHPVFDTAHTQGALIRTLDNPNAFSTSANDWFGYSTDISDNYAIVGAYGEDDAGGSFSGKAYIFNVTTGTLVCTLDNPNAFSTSAGDWFGFSVAISGKYAIVGAYQEDATGAADSGKAYIFNVTTGALVRTLNNPNTFSTGAGDGFGYSVAISGNYAIVGAYTEDDAGGADSGKAYIFNVTTGTLLWTLNNPNAFSTSALDYFGYSVAISGNYAIVGAYQEDATGAADSGKAYIFNVTTGALLWTLNNPNAVLSDRFGYSVAISSNYAIVGAYIQDDTGVDSGKAYIYNVTTGALVHTLNNPNAFSTSANDSFGWSVAISGNYAIVGATGEDDAGGSFSGKAYIYNVTTGALVCTLDNPNAFSTSAGDSFGLDVAISGNYAIVGAYAEGDAGGINSGKAYIFASKDLTYLDKLTTVAMSL